MDLAQAEAYIDARIGLGMKPGTERMVALLDALGRPQDTLRAIAVSGTNGKFSVAVMTAAILESLGLAVGLYTSPHVESITERIRLNGADVPSDAFASSLEYLIPFIDQLEDVRPDRLTYFETLTALAIEIFFDRAVHVAVMETGLGGEWDATNVVDSEVAVVTKVAMDHVAEFEGDLERAAWEKAGTIKQDATVVTGITDPDLLTIVERRAIERGAGPVLRLGREILVDRNLAVGGQSVSVQTPRRIYPDLFLPVFGRHQAENAALAVAACEAFADDELDPDGVAEGLASVRLPARIEAVGRHPLIIVDGGHNPDSATAVLRTITEEFEHDRIHCVVGMLADKQIEEVMGILAGAVQRFHLARPGADRGAEPERLAAALTDAGVADGSMEIHDRIQSALRDCISEAAEEDLVLVFGSFHTAGEARSVLRETGRLPQR